MSIINDAEIPSIIYNTFNKLGFDDFTICINNRKIFNGFFKSLNLTEKSQDILRIIDKIDKIGKDKVKEELSEEVDNNSLEMIMKFLSIDGKTQEKITKLENLGVEDEIFQEGLNDLKQILKYIGDFGVPEQNIKLDLTIARGLDYYTGTVYETFLNKYRNMGSVCSGGRYDNLTEYYTDRKMPGVGISIGLSRLFFQLMDNNIISAENESISKVIVISMTEDYGYPAKVAATLRENGVKVQVNFEDQKLGKKFKYADNIKVEYAIIIGDDEVQSNKVSLKNMKTGEQQTVDIEEALKILK